MWKGNTREACDQMPTFLLRPDNLQALLMGILETLRTANCLLQTTGFISLFGICFVVRIRQVKFSDLSQLLRPLMTLQKLNKPQYSNEIHNEKKIDTPISVKAIW